MIARLLAGFVVVPLMIGPAAAGGAVTSLPFWSKPFPAFYAYRQDGCLERRRIRTPHGLRTRIVDVCRPVIRVYD